MKIWMRVKKKLSKPILLLSIESLKNRKNKNTLMEEEPNSQNSKMKRITVRMKMRTKMIVKKRKARKITIKIKKILNQKTTLVPKPQPIQFHLMIFQILNTNTVNQLLSKG